VITIIGKKAFAKAVDQRFDGLYIALGTGTTSLSPGDTKLENEIFRKKVALVSYFENINFFEIFISGEELNNITITEAGFFFFGAETTNSGLLFARQLLTLFKNVGEIMIVRWTIKYP